jgi:hypothetical protein
METVGIFYVYFVYFTAIGYIFYGHLVYFSPFWYVVPRKIWQPWRAPRVRIKLKETKRVKKRARTS